MKKMYDIPEHPVIANLLRTGYPDGKEPEEMICPICGEAAEQFYVSQSDEIVGCEYCMKLRYYYEFEEEADDGDYA